MKKLDIAPIVGASESLVVEVAEVSDRYNLKDYSIQTLHRFCAPSDTPKGRGQFGVALNEKWTHCIPISISPEGETEIVSVGTLVNEIANHKPDLTIRFE